MDRSRRRWTTVLGCGICGIVAVACDLDRIAAPALPGPHPGTYADEPYLGPVRSYTGPAAYGAYLAVLTGMVTRRTATILPMPPSAREVEVAARLARLRTGSVPATATLAQVSDGSPFFVVAETMVGISESGSRGNATVLAYSRTNYITNISHDLEMELSTPQGTRTFPPLHAATHFWGDSLLTTTTMVGGINCTTNARLSARTTHRAGSAVTVFSLGEDSCGGQEECEPSDEPPTGVAPEPTEPGYNYGEGSSGTTGGGCDGTGGTTPPSSNCHDEYVYVERSTDGGVTWTVIWEGWSIVCE